MVCRAVCRDARDDTNFEQISSQLRDSKGSCETNNALNNPYNDTVQ